MKALVFTRHGGLEELSLSDLPTLEPLPGEVVVRTAAAALNRLDLFVLGGIPGLKLEFPHVLGADGGGVVEAVGEGVSRFRPGDRVVLNAVISCNRCEFCLRGEHSLCMRLGLVGEHRPGTFAEFFRVPEECLEEIDPHVEFLEAAAFSLVFQTSWRMLRTQARIAPGEDVLIHGVGSGVSTASLQIVKFCGGRAFVTSSDDRKLERAADLGADFCYNYRKQDVVAEVLRETSKRGVDIVVDSVGEATWLQSLKLVRRGGRIVSCGATTGPNPATEIRLIFWKQIHIIGSTMAGRAEFREVLKLLNQGRLKPVVDRVFPLSEGRAALEYLRDGRQFGKVLLTLE